MIENICTSLLKKIRKQMPEIDDERAEVIEYGLELIVGEIPKMVLLILIAFILRIGWYVLFAYLTMLPYKIVAGGFHLKTNIGCFIGTCIVYLGNVLISRYLFINQFIKIIIEILLLTSSIIMITLYAPADTVNLPILRKKERKIKKILSYIIVTITLVISLIIKNSILSNIILINVLIETLSISKIAYKLTKNEYGYEVYKKKNILD